MSIPAGDLTTTSYAILGLLAIRPFSTYELAQRMDRSLRRLWPRAQSKIYEEPKKLAAHGLARASREAVGRRPRAVYTITPKGRRALRAWLGRPGAPPSLEWEQLLKVFFAEQGSKADLIATLEDVRAWSRDERARHAEVARAYLAGEGPFQQRAATISLTGRFIFEFSEMIGAWAERSLAIARAWPEDIAAAPPDWSAMRAALAVAGEPLPQTRAGAGPRGASPTGPSPATRGRSAARARSAPAHTPRRSPARLR